MLSRSLPSRPKTWISDVFATVDLAPLIAMAPPLTSRVPVASRLMVIVSSRRVPSTTNVGGSAS
jgi:hypothetical protein